MFLTESQCVSDRVTMCFSFPKRPDCLWGTESLLLNGLRGSFSGVKGLVLQFDCSPQSSAEVKNEWSYIPAVPIRHNDVGWVSFTFVPYEI